MATNRAAWFRKAGWGVMVHFLSHPASSTINTEVSIDDWNARVDSFDVEQFADQLAQCQAGYCIFTLGQNGGYFCSPNQTYDRIVGRQPSRCSGRDLIGDLANALRQHDIKTIVYMPSHAPAMDRQAVEALKCTPAWDAGKWQLKPGSYTNQGVDERLSEFQRNWEAVIGEWSCRWKGNVKGWWFDGCRYADVMYRHDDEPNFASFAAAARAGNPDSIVAFNGGLTYPIERCSSVEDYTAGEVGMAFPISDEPWTPRNQLVVDGCVDGSQYHVLTYLGEYWGRGEPRISKGLARSYTEHVTDLGGVLSWDIPVCPTGRIPDIFVEYLSELTKR